MRRELTLFLIFISILFYILIPFCARAEESSQPVEKINTEQLQQMTYRAIDRALKQEDADYIKHLGMQPDNVFYFLKSSREAIVGWFKINDGKTSYLVDLSQKRLTEAFLMRQKNNTGKMENAFTSYIKIMEKLEKRKVDKAVINLTWNLGFLNRMSKIMTDSKNYSSAVQKTSEFQNGKILEESFKGGI